MKQYHILKKEGKKLVYGAGWYPTYLEALNNVPKSFGSIFVIKVIE